MDRYTRLANEFKDIRNRAYFNLGQKAEAVGDILQALYYYNDAYRLASFQCDSSTPREGQCTRLDAERRMQRILEITDIDPYTSWGR